MQLKKYIFWLIYLFGILAVGQEQFSISGKISAADEPLPYANILLIPSEKGASSDAHGNFTIDQIPAGEYTVKVSFLGFRQERKKIKLDRDLVLNFDLEADSSLDEVVISGTMKPVLRSESPVPVEIYNASYFQKNPTPSIFEALQNVNGVRPQLNCNVCNTGDVHINGLEGPYTLVLIDGMPIVSGLSTVYGLSGIPNSLIDRVEVVKGPASSLYGSEAVGGLINIITKLPKAGESLVVDAFGTGWQEYNADISVKGKVGEKTTALLGLNYYNYSNPIDDNNDNFTDVTLQDRLSIFNKWDFERKNNKQFYLAGRFFYEDRWGGELQWNPSFRGGDSIYGESIYTTRYELLGKYDLPVHENMYLQFSYTDHDQNSVYGDVPYLAQQRIGFGQLIWDKPIKKHNLLIGLAGRYNYYNDNTPATAEVDEVVIPSVFVQDEIKFDSKSTLLLGGRYDYDSRHGSIVTPRLAYKYAFNEEHSIRANFGTGFRVVNLFTEDHAALTGARDVVITEDLNPERSYNANFNYLGKLYLKDLLLTLDASAWYTQFTNAILPDYDTDPNQIIYANLNGKAVSQGLSAAVDFMFTNGIRGRIGATFQDVTRTENGLTRQQILTEKFMGTWAISYKWHAAHLNIDYTGNAYGPMRLPLLGELDPREEYSPLWSIQNIQFTYDGFKDFELYGGVKNLLNWTPNRNNPFLIARSDDPFDREVEFTNAGQVVATPQNPYALTFDPTYVYAPNQGIRAFFGLRYHLQ